jgi:hypothetical protein
MDIIQPIGPPDRDVGPLHRVERAADESARDDRPPRKRGQGRQTADGRPQKVDGPVEGDDGHLHIDVTA